MPARALARLLIAFLTLGAYSCRVVQYGPTVPHLADAHERHDVSLSGSAAAATDPSGFRFQGQAQYCFLKNILVLGNAYSLSGGQFLGDTNVNRIHGFDAGLGWQGYVSKNLLAGISAGYGYQNVYASYDDSITRSRYFYRGGWAQAFVRYKTQDYGAPIFYDLGLHVRHIYARRTFYQYYGYSGPGIPPKRDPWPGNHWLTLPTLFAGATVQLNAVEIFCRGMLTPGWAWKGEYGRNFYYSPFAIELGVSVTFNPKKLHQPNDEWNGDYVR